MLEQTEEFLFPFELVPRGSRIVIYGAGVKGQSYLRQMLMTHYCTVVAMADKNFAGYQNFAVPVCNPEKIHEYAFDYVVIAIRSSAHLTVFRGVLQSQGVAQDKIIYQPAREEPQLFQSEQAGEASETGNRLLICLMGGLGDNIMQKKIVETLVSLAPEVNIDFYCTQGKSFLTYLYQDMPQIRSIELNLGSRYDSHKEQYGAALFIDAMNWLRVDVLHLGRLPQALEQLLCSLKERTDAEHYSLSTSVFLIFYRSFYKRENSYRHMTFDGIIPYHDHKVRIPRTAAAAEAFCNMRLGQYITLNFGNGDAKNSALIAKTWPRERFEQVIEGVHRRYPHMAVVQLGTKGAPELAGVDCYALGRPFAEVSEVLAHAQVHIDIEGGLVHLATQLGTRCIVLFGPTPIWFYGYEENINLQAGLCHSCHCLYPEWYCCARNLPQPECMYSITPKMVLKQIQLALC